MAEWTFFPEPSSLIPGISQTLAVHSSDFSFTASLNDSIHTGNLTVLYIAWPRLVARFHGTFFSFAPLHVCKPPHRNNTKFGSQGEYSLAPTDHNCCPLCVLLQLNLGKPIPWELFSNRDYLCLHSLSKQFPFSFISIQSSVDGARPSRHLSYCPRTE